MGQLRAGAAWIDITPPLGTPMAGYGDRKGVSIGIHDPLRAAAMVLDDGNAAVALVNMDWVGVDAAFVAQVRSLVSAGCPLAPQNVLVTATHTHSGPLLKERYGEGYTDPALTEVTARKVAGVVIQAFSQREPAQWGLARGRAPGIGTNRRDPSGTADDAVTVLRVDGADGPIALAYNFACHPTVLDYHNMRISADYPGAVRATLAQVYGPELPVLFFNGAAGNISTRHMRRESTFREARRMGRMLAGEVMRLAESTTLQPQATVRTASTTVEMPMRLLPTEAEAEQRVAAATAEVKRLEAAGLPPDRGALRTAIVTLQGARATQGLVRLGLKEPIRAEFQAIALGDAVWFCLPGELFCEIGLEVKGLDPAHPVQVVTYANGTIGYILPPAAYAEGGYEAGTSRLAPEAAAAVVSAAQALFAQIGLLEV